MSTAATLAEHERRLNQHEKDIHHIYDELREHRRELRAHGRELRWLRAGMTMLLERFNLEPPPVEEDEEE